MRLLLFIPLLLLVSCKKDKVPEPEPPPEPSKWEVIAGHYKVYDSMNIQTLHRMTLTICLG